VPTFVDRGCHVVSVFKEEVSIIFFYSHPGFSFFQGHGFYGFHSLQNGSGFYPVPSCVSPGGDLDFYVLRSPTYPAI
jgi:hypothetical protein